MVRDFVTFRVDGMQAIDVEIGLGPLGDGDEVSSVVPHVVLPRSNDLVLRVIEELVPMG